MTWNWQQKYWPNFQYQPETLTGFEQRFLEQSGLLLGASKYLANDELTQITVEIFTEEAVTTSQLEGEYLNRDSVQSSIQRHLGLKTDHRRVGPAEHGIAQLMMALHQDYASPLTDQTLFAWHRMLMNGRYDLEQVGTYRTHIEPMQVISGRVDKPHIHFEAPDSERVAPEMEQFLAWYQQSHTLPALTRAGIAHLYFVCIHPFEDGNGRIGRAIAEKALSQSLGRRSLLALSKTVHAHRKAYYQALENNNRSLEITPWLEYFCQTVLHAQNASIQMVELIIEKAKLFERLGDQLNPRQTKVIGCLFKAGPDGFTGGLSTDNYISMTRTSRATATRDLQGLVKLGALERTGAKKGTRYHLLNQHHTKSIL